MNSVSVIAIIIINITSVLPEFKLDLFRYKPRKGIYSQCSLTTVKIIDVES